MPMTELQSPSDSFASHLQVCYEVLLYLASRMMKLQPGEIFEFVTSDAGAVDEIPPWCDLHGYTLLSVEPQPDQQWRFLIRK